jgi:spore coat polysaccharide biosynthesis protein SpsF (cytidylyltransferase family)
MLEIMVNRVRLARGIKKIVVATTINPLDNEIEEECKRIGVDVFRGSESNVLERVTTAGRNNDAAALVVLTGDCPLIDPKLIETCIERFLQGGLDYVANSHVRSYPDGMDVQVVAMNSMEFALKSKLEELEKEHSTLHVRRNTPESRVINILAPEGETFPLFGLTLDEPKDLEVINLVLDYFYPRRDFTCAEIIDFLNLYPKILNINSGVFRKGDN